LEQLREISMTLRNKILKLFRIAHFHALVCAVVITELQNLVTESHRYLP